MSLTIYRKRPRNPKPKPCLQVNLSNSEVIVEVVVKAGKEVAVEAKAQLLVCWLVVVWLKKKIMVNSTLVEAKVEFEFVLITFMLQFRTLHYFKAGSK